MSSFPENKIEKWVSPQNYKFFLKYHRSQISRVYPGIRRLDSSNYDPVHMWNAGVQLVALNYQTGDKAMQLNQGRFLENGNSGYILRPEFMFQDDPISVYDRSSLNDVDPLKVTIRVSKGLYVFLLNSYYLCLKVIAGSHLMKPGKGNVSPFVEIEILGAEFDNAKCKTCTVRE